MSCLRFPLTFLNISCIHAIWHVHHSDTGDHDQHLALCWSNWVIELFGESLCFWGIPLLCFVISVCYYDLGSCTNTPYKIRQGKRAEKKKENAKNERRRIMRRTRRRRMIRRGIIRKISRGGGGEREEQGKEGRKE